MIAVDDLLLAERFPVPADVLIWTLEGARAIVRPSGTEPKLKCYVEAESPVGGGTVEEARRRGSEVVQEVLDGVAALLGAQGV